MLMQLSHYCENLHLPSCPGETRSSVCRAPAPLSFLPRSLAMHPQCNRNKSGRRLQTRALKTSSLAVIGD